MQILNNLWAAIFGGGEATPEATIPGEFQMMLDGVPIPAEGAPPPGSPPPPDEKVGEGVAIQWPIAETQRLDFLPQTEASTVNEDPSAEVSLHTEEVSSEQDLPLPDAQVVPIVGVAPAVAVAPSQPEATFQPQTNFRDGVQVAAAEPSRVPPPKVKIETGGAPEPISAETSEAVASVPASKVATAVTNAQLVSEELSATTTAPASVDATPDLRLASVPAETSAPSEQTSVSPNASSSNQLHQTIEFPVAPQLTQNEASTQAEITGTTISQQGGTVEGKTPPGNVDFPTQPAPGKAPATPAQPAPEPQQIQTAKTALVELNGQVVANTAPQASAQPTGKPTEAAPQNAKVARAVEGAIQPKPMQAAAATPKDAAADQSGEQGFDNRQDFDPELTQTLEHKEQPGPFQIETQTRRAEIQSTKPEREVSQPEIKAVIKQVADRIEILAARPREGVTIHLTPADLGSVTLTVKAVGNMIDTQISASDPGVRQALEQSQPQLAASLEQRGFTLNQISVSSSSVNQDAQARHQQQHQHDQPSHQRPATTPQFGTHVPTDPAQARQFARKATGVDLWI